MTTPTDPAGQTWEQVLAAVEQDVARTADALAALAAAPTALQDRASGTVPGRGLSPAETQLLTPGPVLPPMAAMPPVPAHLATRISQTRARITELQSQLRAELAALGELRAEQATHALRAARLAAATRGAAATPVYFDSHV